jgi:RNA polymerase sigma factor (sigma-70 family)
MIELGVPAVPATRPAGDAVVVEDDAAFASWYRNEHPRLLAAMTIVTNDLHVAQDVTAEAFARALAAWKRVSNMESPTGWTYRVALNVVRRRARRAALEQRALRRMPAPAEGLPPERAIELWDAVRALPPRARTAIALRYAAGLSEAEVAEAMHVKVGTVSATLSNARRALAASLGEPTPETAAEDARHG